MNAVNTSKSGVMPMTQKPTNANTASMATRPSAARPSRLIACVDTNTAKRTTKMPTAVKESSLMKFL